MKPGCEHNNQLALTDLIERINEPRSHKTYKKQRRLNANYIKELKRHPEQRRWSKRIKYLHDKKILTGRMKLHKQEERTLFMFDLNLSADPQNERARKTLAMLREIVGLVTDAKLHAREIYQKIGQLSHLDFFLKPLKSSLIIAVDKLIDRFVYSTSNSVLSFIVTNYIEQCLGGTDDLDVSTFIVRIGPAMQGLVDADKFMKSDASDRFHVSIRKMFIDYCKVYTAVYSLQVPFKSLLENAHFVMLLHCAKND